jgi:hypothetical protein
MMNKMQYTVLEMSLTVSIIIYTRIRIIYVRVLLSIFRWMLSILDYNSINLLIQWYHVLCVVRKNRIRISEFYLFSRGILHSVTEF